MGRAEARRSAWSGASAPVARRPKRTATSSARSKIFEEPPSWGISLTPNAESGAFGASASPIFATRLICGPRRVDRDVLDEWSGSKSRADHGHAADNRVAVPPASGKVGGAA